MSNDDVFDPVTGEVIKVLADTPEDKLRQLFDEFFSEAVFEPGSRDLSRRRAFPDPTRLIDDISFRPLSPLEQLLQAERVNRERLLRELNDEVESPEDADDFEVDDDLPDFQSQYEVQDMEPQFLRAKDGKIYDRSKVKVKSSEEPPSEAIQTEKEGGEPPVPPRKRKRLQTVLDLLDAASDED